MFKKIGIFLVEPLIFICFVLGCFMVYTACKQFDKNYITKTRMINDCIIENKYLPNPKEVCLASYKLSQLENK